MHFRSLLAIFFLTTVAYAAPVDYVRDIKPILSENCYSCHGPDKQKASLRLDSIATIKEGGDSGPALIPKKSAESRMMIAVNGGNDGIKKMPPKSPLTKDQIALLTRWIDEGASGPSTEDIGSKSTKSNHWSFQPITRPALPKLQNEKWVRNGIDSFVLARLEKEGIKPSPEADKTTLIRRVYLDMLGLPPTPEQVEKFLKDASNESYEKMIEEVLASPHYGERWGRHWLDAARYADSHGYSIDSARNIWKYRDWVIEAFNKDMPFNQFTIEQFAGDLLPNSTPEQKVATGFHRNTMINQEGGINLEQFRIDSIFDRVNTTGSVFLGLTVGCAQCHDHKFDPISQREYYQFFAFFNNSDEPNYELITPEVKAKRDLIQKQIADLNLQIKSLDPTTPERVEKWERSITDESRPKLSKAIATLFEVAPNGRTPKQIQTIEDAYRRNDQNRHAVGALINPFSALVHSQLLKTRFDLVKKRDSLKKQEPSGVSTMVLQERKNPRMTHVLRGGDFLRPGVEVQSGTPAILPPLKKSDHVNRLDLGTWLVSPDNPLTARVIMNRFWGIYFGTGIVETENDFGTQGTLPSHPELLDWLASEFMNPQGDTKATPWSMKHMHRLILTSSTYRQSSKIRPELEINDARNRLLARQSRLRLEAEVVRDVSLAASGLLNPKIGGPSIFPPQPEGVYRFTQVDKAWKASSGPDRFRRGMYTHFWRSAPHPALVVFDAPDSTTSCTRRNRSNTPLQALTLLNDSGFYEYAQAFTNRILTQIKGTDSEKLQQAFCVCFARTPNERELYRLESFLAAQKESFLSNTQEAKELVGESKESIEKISERAAWLMVARALLNVDEFITRE